jgi:HAMP domain-containing protein/putative methionine-R-sulfoxide reductase with GAF domain
MIHAFLNLRLKIKLIFAFGSLLLLSAILILIFFQAQKKSDTYQLASAEVDGINIHMLEMDAALKYFMFEGYKADSFQQHGKSSYLQSYSANLSSIHRQLSLLRQSGIVQEDSLTGRINIALKSISAHVTELTQRFKIRGFKDYGLEGKLREAIHKVEKSPFPYDKAGMLTLRRHEKDFFLRKDLKYQQEFNTKVDEFTASIQQAPADEYRDAILKNLADYKKQFNEVVAIESQIGFKETEGSKGSINHNLSELKKSIVYLRSSVKEKNALYQQGTTIALVILFIAQLILGVVLAIVYADIITRAVRELLEAMKDLSEGILPEPLIVKSHEEIGKTKTAFNQLLDRLKAASKFSEALGDGNLQSVYDDKFSDDILARSLIKMQQQLSLSQEKQNIINWENQGTAQLNDILKNENEEISKLSDRILKQLVVYLKANQGALYILHDDGRENYLERVATYAYEKKRYVDHRVAVGQGLAGQCVLERATILLTEVPRDYVRITSGLGGAVPGFIIILPLIIRDKVLGVLELASFRRFETYQVRFLEKISENIASILLNKALHTETSQLLAAAQERTQQLMSQEEEIRQNAEEMQAVQEQMQRQQTELMREIAELKAKLKEQKTETDPAVEELPEVYA